MLGRRALMGLIGLTPVLGPTVARELGEAAGKMTASDDLMKREVQRMQDRLLWSKNLQAKQRAEEFKMKRWTGLTKRAQALALKDPTLRAAIRAHFEKHISLQPVQTIDPDLMVLKSVSPMAKVYYQRQRNIERHVDDFFRRQTDENYHDDDGNVFMRFVDGIMRKVIGVDPDRDNPYHSRQGYGQPIGGEMQRAANAPNWVHDAF